MKKVRKVTTLIMVLALLFSITPGIALAEDGSATSDIVASSVIDNAIHYTIAPWYVFYDVRGGTNLNPNLVETRADGTLASLPTPTRSGRTFLGWYSEREGGELITADNVFTKNTRIYAAWNANAITFNANGGSSVSSITTGADGKLGTIPTNSTKNGRTLVGWVTATYGGNNNTSTTPSPMIGGQLVTTDTVFTNTATVYAIWQGSTVTLNSRGGTAFEPLTTDENGKVTLPTPVKPAQNEGGVYNFKGWYTDPVNGKLVTSDTIISTDTTLYAMYSYDSGSVVKSNLEVMDPEKTRVIVTTDCERDDLSSVVQFLMFSSDYEVEGIIHTSSRWHNALPNANGYWWAGPEVLLEWVDAYSEGYENLIKHEPDYPTPEYIRSVTKMGNIVGQATYESDTEGSELIKSILLDRTDNRPVMISNWGGPNTVCRALKSIEDEYSGTPEWPEIKAYVSNKAVLQMVLDQDGSYWSYIMRNWPDLVTYHQAGDNAGISYSYLLGSNNNANAQGYAKYFQAPWTRTYFVDKFQHHSSITTSNINEGILMTHLYFRGGGKTTPEGSGMESGTQWTWNGSGDSISFLNLIEYGLRASEDGLYGGWGGRFEHRYNPYTPPTFWGSYVAQIPVGVTGYTVGVCDSFTEDFVPWGNVTDRYRNAVSRWVNDCQNEIAARAAWLISPPGEVSTAPVVSVDTELDINATIGQEITVNGSAKNPDGADVKLFWFYYRDASSYAHVPATNSNNGSSVTIGSYTATVPYTDDGDGKLTFTVPADAKVGDTIHMVLTGTTQNTKDGLERSRYQRVIVTVRAAADYDAVDAAIFSAGEIDRDLYTPQSLAVVDEAIDAVVWDLLDVDQEKVDGYAAAINEAIDALVLIAMIDAKADSSSFISIVETSKNSRVWELTFTVTKIYNDGTTEDVLYLINLNGNNANLDGVYEFGEDSDLSGYKLVYDIKGNGSNIKTFEILIA